MADQPDYKHITVNPAEEDDIVIHAGAVGAAGKSDVSKGFVDAVGAVDEGIESAEAVEAANASDAADVVADAQEAAYMNKEPAEDVAASVASATASRDAYQRTTLDDIQSSKMPRTQIAVIAVAVVAIIAFAAWYVFFS